MINVLRAHFLDSEISFLTIKILNQLNAFAFESISLKFTIQISYQRLHKTLVNSLSKFSVSLES